MSQKLLLILALIAFASAPVVIGSAEQSKEAPATKEVKKEEEAPKRKVSTECLASEEVIQDLELREKKLKDKEESLKEREKELAAQQDVIKEELAKLDGKRAEIQGVHQKAMAEREEQVNKLIETFEGMSPKAAAQVLGGVDDELAVMALSKLSSAKAGKILSNLKAEQSARLSEMMAYGKVNRKESNRGESNNRAPASK